MTRHHIIVIGWFGGRGFTKVIGSYATRQEALAAHAAYCTPRRIAIYRDGTTGKRYSFNECKELLSCEL